MYTKWFLVFLSLFFLTQILLSGKVLSADHEELILRLKLRRELVRKWAVVGPNGSACPGQFSHNTKYCASGDANLYNGIGCLAAVLAQDGKTEEIRCAEARAAQGANGRWWRSPSLVEVPYPSGAFSRDQTRGVFGYLLANGHLSQNPLDRAIARKDASDWLNWILHEGGKKLCTEGKSRCDIRGGTMNMMNVVFRLIGAMPPKHGELYKRHSFIRKVYKSRNYLFLSFLPEISLLPFGVKFAKKYYPTHLKALSVLLYSVYNMDATTFRVRKKKVKTTLRRAIKLIYRIDKKNALYKFLRHGVTAGLVENVMSRCPVEREESESGQRDWLWQRNSEIKSYPLGHDCIFLLNLMIARLNGRLNWYQ